MNDEWTLPDGWEWAEFQDIAQVAADLVDPANYLESAHIAPNHIESGSGRLLQYTTILDDKVTSPKHRFRPGQILYSKIRPYLAKAVLVDFEGLCSADIYPISAMIDAAYLHKWLICLTFTEWASRSQGRTVLPKINQNGLAVLKVPVPPLQEQRCIVAKIESLQARSRKAREALEAIPPLLEKFQRSVLAAAFRGDLTADWRERHPDVEPATALLDRIRQERRHRWEEAELARMKSAPRENRWKAKYQEPEPVDDSDLPELPKGWTWAALECLTPAEHPIVYGIIQPGPLVKDGVPFIRPVDISDGTVDFHALPRTSSLIATSYQRASLLPGDLVYSIVGTIGKTFIVPPMLAGANITQSSVRVRPFSPLNADFFIRALQSPLLTNQIARLQFGNAVQRLNVEHMRRLAIPLPPIAEWEVLAPLIQAALNRAKAIEEQVANGLLDQARLDQSILAKAFQGELVPQDPTDEPASVLLDRIRAERHSTNGAAPKPRRRS